MIDSPGSGDMLYALRCKHENRRTVLIRDRCSLPTTSRGISATTRKLVGAYNTTQWRINLSTLVKSFDRFSAQTCRAFQFDGHLIHCYQSAASEELFVTESQPGISIRYCVSAYADTSRDRVQAVPCYTSTYREQGTLLPYILKLVLDTYISGLCLGSASPGPGCTMLHIYLQGARDSTTVHPQTRAGHLHLGTVSRICVAREQGTLLPYILKLVLDTYISGLCLGSVSPGPGCTMLHIYLQGARDCTTVHLKLVLDTYISGPCLGSVSPGPGCTMLHIYLQGARDSTTVHPQTRAGHLHLGKDLCRQVQAVPCYTSTYREQGTLLPYILKLVLDTYISGLCLGSVSPGPGCTMLHIYLQGARDSTTVHLKLVLDTYISGLCLGSVARSRLYHVTHLLTGSKGLYYRTSQTRAGHLHLGTVSRICVARSRKNTDEKRESNKMKP
ncbi:hypothetical protein J6590_058729 [Homalodisca vitripennis]|nr:hypothetical protein J6590_058729 [Homalodisca vitripennis]